jgi:Gram-negative porin
MNNRVMTIALASLLPTAAAHAAIPELPELRLERGGLDIRLGGVVSGQTALVEENRPGKARLATGYDASVRINAEWVTKGGLLFGAYVDQGRISRETEVLQTGEAFGFVSSDFGRVEVGLQDGGNEQLAFRAPIVGLGQVRGDFSRYAGSQALLVSPDSGDAFKIVYLSPPVAGFRAGVSWAPKFQRNQRDPDPTDRIIVRDVIEIGGSFQQPVGDWVLGVSSGYVTGRAAPETGRRGLKSWNVGLDVRNGPLRIGGSFVDRGDSNRRTPGFNQREISAGVAWVKPRWGASASIARTSASTERNRLVAVGGYYALNRNIQIRADITRFVERDVGSTPRRGVVGLLELAFLF